MPSIGPRWARARDQGLVLAVGVAVGAVVVGWLFGGEQIAVPGLVSPIPAVRLFPAVVATAGVLALLEPWRRYEVSGVRSVTNHRVRRFLLATAVVFAAGYGLSWNAGSWSILLWALLGFAVTAVALGLLGQQWWVVVALALYGQLFLQSYDRFQPHTSWDVIALAVALPCYLARGSPR